MAHSVVHVSRQSVLALQIANFVVYASGLRNAPPGTLLWAVLYLAAMTADVAWAHSCTRHRPGPLHSNGYLRWHGMELLRLAICVCDIRTTLHVVAHSSTVPAVALPVDGNSNGSGSGSGRYWNSPLAWEPHLFFAAVPAHLALQMGLWRLRPRSANSRGQWCGVWLLGCS